MSKKYRVKRYEQTCPACPSQWDIYTTEGEHIYARYRWGHLCVRLNPWHKDEKILYDKSIGEGLDGYLSTEELMKHTASVLDWSEV